MDQCCPVSALLKINILHYTSYVELGWTWLLSTNKITKGGILLKFSLLLSPIPCSPANGCVTDRAKKARFIRIRETNSLPLPEAAPTWIGGHPAASPFHPTAPFPSAPSTYLSITQIKPHTRWRPFLTSIFDLSLISDILCNTSNSRDIQLRPLIP